MKHYVDMMKEIRQLSEAPNSENVGSLFVIIGPIQI